MSSRPVPADSARDLGVICGWQERLPHSEPAVARAHGGCEDKGRWLALLPKPVTAKLGDQGAGSIAVRNWRD